MSHLNYMPNLDSTFGQQNFFIFHFQFRTALLTTDDGLVVEHYRLQREINSTC